MSTARARIDSDVAVAVYEFPTPQPQADATLTWEATTAVVVRIGAHGAQGLGWTYSSPAAARIVTADLVPVLSGRSVFDPSGTLIAMRRACRNIGTKGVVAQAISAVDVALWDLRARLLAVPLSTLFGTSRHAIAVYGSGGFTTLDDGQLDDQIDLWRRAGCPAMKIKIGERCGSDPARDLTRVRRFSDRAGEGVRLMVDANGGYTPGQARRVGAELDRLGVEWFEEPVTSDNLDGLAVVRDSVRCDVAAGEYVYDEYDAAELLGVVDCLQLDLTRCGGYTGFLRCAALAAARGLDVSAHCAPSLHAPVAGAVPNLRDIEWFIDHARLEPLLVDGAPTVAHGELPVPVDGPGHGMRIAATAADYRQH
ncbi:enolase C-terminal domain-like protein [Nocardia halotolerans]|uniref:Enolase C-terminal domain-like protein n=1 Tax=Nocardia halotolerans TaxID=1755878 RepID=A0ABV8VNR0_9NOCA